MCECVISSVSDTYSSVCNMVISVLFFNPFYPSKPNEMSHSYHFEQSISALRVVGYYFSLLFN